jgi:hypothetical protein
MHIVVSLTGHYDWEPVPSDVKVTEADLVTKKVKPGLDGKFLMKVTRERETHTQITLPEEQLTALIISERIRSSGGSILTRPEAVSLYLATHVMPHHAHRKHMKNFEVYDDGPDEKLFVKMISRFIVSGNIDKADGEEMRKSYMLPANGSDHVGQLMHHFRVK